VFTVNRWCEEARKPIKIVYEPNAASYWAMPTLHIFANDAFKYETIWATN
jgi:hypothetical protein